MKLNNRTVNEWAAWARNNELRKQEEECSKRWAKRMAEAAAQKAALQEAQELLQLELEQLKQDVAAMKLAAMKASCSKPVRSIIQPADPTLDQLTDPCLVVVPRTAKQPAYRPKDAGAFDWPKHKAMLERVARKEREAKERRKEAAFLRRQRAEKRREKEAAERQKPAILAGPARIGQNLGALVVRALEVD